jgi:outer membrane protein OmpA-like peptidoglycan-associated protein
MVAGAGHAQMMMSQGTQGWYLRGETGWNHADGLGIHGSNGGLAASTGLSEGYLIGGALGYHFGNLSLEANVDRRANDASSIHIGNPGAFPAATGGGAGGTLEGISFMGNLLYDLPYNWNGFRPYIGVGAGVTHLALDGLSAGSTTIANDDDMVGSVQAMVGVRYDLTDHWGLGLEYRFLNGFHPAFTDSKGQVFSTSDYRNHSILLSATYSFGAPPAPPPPTMPAAAPAPMPAPAAAPSTGARQLYIVFFDFDKSSITEAGRKVLDAAAVAVKQDQAVRIELTGYTDTMGTVPYNMKLSERRADAVRDYLSKAGIPANRMDVAWKGKTDLRVPTPDQVREPQNRRVEIIIP